MGLDPYSLALKQCNALPVFYKFCFSFRENFLGD